MNSRHFPLSLLLLLTAAGLAAAGPAYAQQPAAPAASASPATPATPAAELSEGEIRKIDKAAGKLTLRHGELKNLDMPPMTMVFQLRDPALLGSLKVGDKVRFRAEQQGGSLVLTDVRPR